MPQETDAEKIARFERRIEELVAENQRLGRALEEALRAAKRQAAPFSRDQAHLHPQKPVRKQDSSMGGNAVANGQRRFTLATWLEARAYSNSGLRG